MPSGPVSGVGALQLSLGGADGHGFDFAALFAALQSVEGAVPRHSSPDAEAAPALDNVLSPDAGQAVQGGVEGALFPDMLAMGNMVSAPEQAADAVQSAEALLGLLPPAGARALGDVVPLRPAVQILVAHLTATIEAGADMSDAPLATGKDIDTLALEDGIQPLDLAFLADWLKAPVASAQDGDIPASDWPVEQDASFMLGVVNADLANPEQPVAAAFGEMMQAILRGTQAQWPTDDWDITGDLAHPPVRVLAAMAFDAGVNPTSVRMPEGAAPFVQTAASVGGDIALPMRDAVLPAPQSLGMVPAAPSPEAMDPALPPRGMGDVALTSGATAEMGKLPELTAPLTKAEQPVELAMPTDRATKDAATEATIERAETLRVLSLGAATDMPKPVAVAASAQAHAQTSTRARTAFAEAELRAAKDGTPSGARVADTGAAASKPSRATPVAPHLAPLPLTAAEPAQADLGMSPAAQSSGGQMAGTGGAGTSGGMAQGQNLPAVLDLQRQGWTKTLVNRAAGLAQGGGTLTLKILPQHLGQITLKLTEGRKGMDLRIVADVPSTAAMLRGIETQISSAFEEAGLTLENYSAQTGKEGGGTAPDDEPQPNSNGPDDLAQEALADENAQLSARADQSLLNIVV